VVRQCLKIKSYKHGQNKWKFHHDLLARKTAHSINKIVSGYSSLQN